MAKPRVFISSTYYDLKHLRSSLENFLESMGFEPILSERGDIAYSPDVPLEESCYREARSADIFVLIIGGRYGSESSSPEKKPSRTFVDQYDSITKQEYKNALNKGIPVYILIESNVHSEYSTFLKNSDNEDVEYAHVDSVNIFHFIREILSQPRNNPIFPFERYADMEEWLKEQWAGLFKELLGRQTEAQQMVSLTSKVSELGEINQTLKKYMETIISKVSPDKSEKLIEEESKRLEEAQRENLLRANNAVDVIRIVGGWSFEEIRDVIVDSTTFKGFIQRLRKLSGTVIDTSAVLKMLPRNMALRESLNEAREILGKPRFEDIDQMDWLDEK